jgi:hypothetical protein
VIENKVEVPVEHIVERIIRQENIIEEEVIYEIEKRVPKERIIEEIVEVPVEHVTEVKVDVIVERQVYVDNIIETEVMVENRIEKPIMVEKKVETELDIELQASLEYYMDEIEHMKEKKHKLEKLLKDLQHDAAKRVTTDFYCEMKHLNQQIAALKIEMSMWKKVDHKASTREKHIHVTYIPCPEAEALRREIDELRNRNQQVSQKIQFQDTRTSYGHRNYVFEDTVVEGKKVRAVRKSNKNSQNTGVTIMKEGDAHLVSRLVSDNI